MGAPRSDPLRAPRQRAVLEAVARLTLEMRRAPTMADVSRDTGRDKKAVRVCVTALRRLGFLESLRNWIPLQPVPLRLTARARIALGLPLLVYIAWPLPPPTADQAAQDNAHAIGAELAALVLGSIACATPVTPYLTPWSSTTRERIDAAAVPLAILCDAAIAYRDPLLLGRPDVVAAERAGLGVTVLDRAAFGEILAGADPWGPPWCVNYPQRRARS